MKDGVIRFKIEYKNQEKNEPFKYFHLVNQRFGLCEFIFVSNSDGVLKEN